MCSFLSTVICKIETLYIALSVLDCSENTPGIAGLLGFAPRQLYHCLHDENTYLTDWKIFSCATVRERKVLQFCC